MGSEKYINLSYCSPRQRDGGSVFSKSILRYNNTKMSDSIHVNEGFDWTEILDNAEETSYYVQLDQLPGLPFLPL